MISELLGNLWIKNQYEKNPYNKFICEENGASCNLMK